MSEMFIENEDFNVDISNWDVSSVTNMSTMFKKAESFNQDLSSWDVSNVTNMYTMFYRASSFNGNISSWDVSSATTIHQMFYGTTNFNQDISGWDVSNLTEMMYLFALSNFTLTYGSNIFCFFISINSFIDWFDKVFKLSSVFDIVLFLGRGIINSTFGFWNNFICLQDVHSLQI